MPKPKVKPSNQSMEMHEDLLPPSSLLNFGSDEEDIIVMDKRPKMPKKKKKQFEAEEDERAEEIAGNSKSGGGSGGSNSGGDLNLQPPPEPAPVWDLGHGIKIKGIKIQNVFKHRKIQKAMPEPLIRWDGPHIQEYSPAKLFRHHVWAIRGTVFDLRQVFPWLQLLFLLIIAFGVAFYMKLNHDENSSEEAIDDHWWDHLNSASQMVNNMVIFLLGFYIAQVINRWWETRLAYGGFLAGVRNISLLSATYLSMEDARPMRHQLVRYCSLLHSWIYIRYATNKDVDELVEQGILYPDEWDILKDSFDPAMTITHWCLGLLVRAVQQELMYVPEVGLPALQNAMLEIRRSIATVDTHIKTQLPFPYVHMLTVIVKITLITLAATLGQQAGSSYLKGHSAWMAFDVFRLLFTNFFYQGLLELQVILSNPFLDHPAHFPKNHNLKNLARETSEIAKDPENVPGIHAHVSHWDVSDTKAKFSKRI